MRIFRAVATVLTTLLLGIGLLTATSTTSSAGLPERQITISKPRQVSYDVFRVRGRVEALRNGTFVIQRKTCRSCTWRKYRVEETNRRTRYVARVNAPKRGKWRYRVRVRKSDGYATSYSRTVTVAVG